MSFILEALKADQAIRYAIVSTASLACYEYLLILDNEIRYLWGRRISFGGVLLFLCRYLPFASISTMYVYILTTDLNPSDCIAGVRASACITYVQFFLSALVLHMRAYAVWGGSKKILHLLVLTYVGVIVGGSYSAYLLIMSINSLLLLTPNGCIPLLLKDDLWIALVLLIFSASLSFGLLIIKSTKHARVLGNST